MLLQRYEHVRFNDAGRRLGGETLVAFLAGVEKAIVALEPIDDALLTQLPQLRRIAKFGVGLDTIDTAALARHDVTLGWEGGVNKRAVAEVVIAQSINLLRGIHTSNAEVRSGGWRAVQGRELSSLCLGVLGCGHIGKEVIRLLQPFGTRVLAHDIRSFPTFYDQHRVTAVSLDGLLQQSDIVSIHVPLDDTTRGMMDEHRLQQMRLGAFLINTARGGIVDEIALAMCLESGAIAGAAFDVFAQEPPVASRLLALPNFVATAHLGGSSIEAIRAMGCAAIDGLKG
jgi:phosphoglycerate dehydrogenase-like enzyme